MSKKIFSVLICALLCVFLLTSCQSAAPMQVGSLAELSQTVGFDVVNPMNIPDGYALAGYYAAGNNLAQIVYVNGENELIFAMTSLQKVECDLGGFDQTKSVDVGGVNFDLSLSGGSVHLAVAHAGGYSYAIYSKTGLSEDEITRMAGGLKLQA